MQASPPVAEGWGNCGIAARILGVSRSTVERAAKADELTHRWVRGRLLIWLPHLLPDGPVPVEPAKKAKRGRPKSSEPRQ